MAEKRSLPVIESCDGCGACCFKQSSPPGYVYILCNPSEKHEDGPFADDAERLKQMPADVVRELRQYIDSPQSNFSDGVCFWLDPITRKCRHYEWRPSICREEVQIGDRACRAWRKGYANFVLTPSPLMPAPEETMT